MNKRFEDIKVGDRFKYKYFDFRFRDKNIVLEVTKVDTIVKQRWGYIDYIVKKFGFSGQHIIGDNNMNEFIFLDKSYYNKINCKFLIDK